MGWLDAHHAFERGHVSEEVLRRLRWLASERRVAQTRGYHSCPFCPSGEPAAPRTATDSALGSAEVWVPDDEEGRYFAAPVLVIHYIAAHQYAPPDVFMKALERLEIGTHVPDLDTARRNAINTRLNQDLSR